MTKVADDAVRERVLAAAARLFVEKGFAGTAIQHIAERLGVARTVVYYYFRDKEAILTALVEEITVKARQLSTSILKDRKLDPLVRLQKVIYQHALLILTHPDEFRVLDRSEDQLPADVSARHIESKRRILDNITETIEEGVKAGRFRVVDSRIAAFSLIGMCSWTAFWFNPQGEKSAKEIAIAVADLAVSSVARPAERRLDGQSVEASLKLLQEDLSHLGLLLAERGKPAP